MKRLFTLLFFASVLMAVIIIAGCSDDDDDNGVNTTTPGDLNDPDFAMFMEEFSEIDNMTGHIFEFTMGECVDTIFEMAENPPPVKRLVFDDTLHVDYHAGSGFWYCTQNVMADFDVMLTITDSLKFMHGDVAVQWPNPALLTAIYSYTTVVPSGSGITSGIMHQNIVVTPLSVGSDTIVVTGTADVSAETEYTDIYGSDTTVCTTVLDYDVSVNSLHIDMGSESDDGPYSGSLEYTGTMNKSCTGADPESISGQWNAVTTFAGDDTMNLTVTHNGVVWTILDW